MIRNGPEGISPHLLYNGFMFRKIVTVLLCMFLSAVPVYAEGENTTPSPSPSEEPQSAVSVSAAKAVLIDEDSGTVLFDKNSSESADPGSLVKIMSVYLGVTNLSSDQELTMSDTAFETYSHDTGVLWINRGETLSAESAEYASMLTSANDTTAMIAEGVSGDQDTFVSMMNQTASDLGMTGTVFSNVFGTADGTQTSTAADIALLVRKARDNDAFSAIFGAASYTIPATNVQSASRTIVNDCGFLKSSDSNYNEEVTGGRIAGTDSAGYSMVVSASRGGTNLIAVVLEEADRASAYADISALLEYGFSKFQTVTISAEEIGTKTVEVTQNSKHVYDVTFSVDSGFSILLSRDTDASNLSAEIVVQNEDSENPDDITAQVVFTLDGSEIGTADMNKEVTAVQEETESAAGGLQKLSKFDIFCIGVLLVLLLLKPMIRFFQALTPPKG